MIERQSNIQIWNINFKKFIIIPAIGQRSNRYVWNFFLYQIGIPDIYNCVQTTLMNVHKKYKYKHTMNAIL